MVNRGGEGCSSARHWSHRGRGYYRKGAAGDTKDSPGNGHLDDNKRIGEFMR